MYQSHMFFNHIKVKKYSQHEHQIHYVSHAKRALYHCTVAVHHQTIYLFPLSIAHRNASNNCDHGGRVPRHFVKYIQHVESYISLVR